GLVNPNVTIRGSTGDPASRVSTFTIGDYSGITAGSSTAGAGSVDFTGGTVNARIDQLKIGVGKASTGTPTIAGSLTFNQGTIDANAVTLATQGGSATAPVNAPLTIGGSGILLVGAGGITLGQCATPQAVVAGTLAVNGGSVSMGADITDGGGTST